MPARHARNEESLKLLFVCSRNQWRSPTAEKLYAGKPLITARSCGTSKNARRRVTAGDLKWADIVFVMEQKHKQMLLGEYPGEMRFKVVHVLNIPDNYQFMDPELIEEIIAAVAPIISQSSG